MRLTYDAQANALSLIFREEAVERSREVAPGVILNLDLRGEAVGIAVLNARRWIGTIGLSQIAIDLHDLWSEP